jgi:phytoene synthase
VPWIDRYHLRKEDFLAIIDGMDMDAAQDIRAPSLSELDLYCDRVASAVGRLSVKIFGMADGPGFELAHHLGRALQLTNILRDLDEDAGADRLYLPSEILSKAGIAVSEPDAVISDPAIDSVCREVAKIAHGHYQQAWRILHARPAGLLRAARLMAAVYGEILSRMEKTGWSPPRERIRIGKGQLLLTVFRSILAG